MNAIQHGNAIIKIYRPTLTKEEREKRETRIKVALQQYEREKQKGEKQICQATI